MIRTLLHAAIDGIEAATPALRGHGSTPTCHDCDVAQVHADRHLHECVWSDGDMGIRLQPMPRRWAVPVWGPDDDAPTWITGVLPG